jgi:hypothetical protein
MHIPYVHDLLIAETNVTTDKYEQINRVQFDTVFLAPGCTNIVLNMVDVFAILVIT